jgi:glyoxylase-like metal-dependent hydrolase (beta-lactamase superfamily II)
MTLGSGNDRIELYYFGRAHTNGDAWVLFPALRVVHAGDAFSGNNSLPILDANNGGSGVDIPDTLMKAHAALNRNADQIITGHSTVMTFDDLRKWADWNREFLTQVRTAKQAGKTPEQFAAEWRAPSTFAAPANDQARQSTMMRLQANAQTIMNELK